MTLDEAAARLGELSKKPVRPYSTVDFGRERNDAGRSVVVPEKKAAAILAELRKELGPGLVAFIGCTRSLAKNPPKGSEIVVAPGESQFDILRVAQSDAINYGMETEDVVRKLQEYDAAYGIDIVHAEVDVVEFALKTLPPDLAAFCEDLYEFCPDIVEQGAGSVEELAESIEATGTVYLWWD